MEAFITVFQSISIRTEFADSMVTLGMARSWRKRNLSCWIHLTAQSTPGEQKWESLLSEHSVGFQIKIGRPKFYASEMIMLA